MVQEYLCFQSLCHFLLGEPLATLDCNFRSGEEFYTVSTVLGFTFDTPFCVILKKQAAVIKNKYEVSAKIYSSSTTHPAFGLLFNAKDLRNYEFVYI